MKIKDVMNKSIITCAPGDSIGEAARLLRENHISGMPVVESGKIVGMVSEGDLLKLFESPESSGELWLPSPLEIIEIPIRSIMRLEETKKALENMTVKPVRDIMEKTVHTISQDDTLEEASTKITRYKVNRLPVVEKGKLVGIVARSDIIKGLSTPQE
ncbi:MAG: CBS domain-containing protein [Candidatus Methanoperedens sp.]|jgi:CBS domain-containing protein|nr:CBS domain-containing protein [Candidatus Methanoperedens sp.]PKL52886.1 MAG: histidine kinase [Candidatus Methanoperedenaceae archaeon HGW-Methanoperedenaceae-1]